MDSGAIDLLWIICNELAFVIEVAEADRFNKVLLIVTTAVVAVSADDAAQG